MLPCFLVLSTETDLTYMNKAFENSSSQTDQEKQFESEKMDAVGGLVAGVSHEINTPLGVNIANCTLLMELLDELKQDFDNGELDTDKFAEFLETSQDITSSMLKNMQRASKLLTSFKKVAVKKSEEASQLEQVNVSELVTEFIASYEHHSQNKTITFIPRFPPKIIVTTYPAVLIQILTALTSNVMIHASGPCHEHCKITITIAPAGDGYQFTFADDGVGITEEELKKVFEPFYTTKRGAGNAGLGLSVVYNLVKVTLASDIYNESKPEGGFVVSFKLHNLMAE